MNVRSPGGSIAELALEQAGIGVFEVSPEHGLTLSPTLLGLFGYSASDVPTAQTQWALSLVHPEDRQTVAAQQALLARGDPIETKILYRVLHASGDYLTARATARRYGDCTIGTLQCVAEKTEPQEADLRRKEDLPQLSESAEALDSVLAHLPNQVFWKDRDLVYRRCNDDFARVVGLQDRFEVVGKTDFDFQRDTQHAESYREWDVKIMNEGKAVLDILEPYDTADGNTGYVLTSKIPTRDAEGNVTGILGVCTDVTALKRLETDLEERKILADRAESMLNAALSLSKLGAWEMDIESGEFVASAHWLDIHGLSRTRFSAADYTNLIHPEDRPHVLEAYQKVLDGCDEYHTQHRIIRHNDGEIRIVMAKGAAERNLDGKLLGFSGFAQDITEEARAGATLLETKKQLEHTRSFLDSILDAIPHVVFVKSAKSGKYILANQAAADFPGMTKEAILGKTDAELFPAADAEQFLEKDRRALAPGVPYTKQEEWVPTPSGKRALSTIKKAIRDPNTGNALYLLGVSEDVTGLKEAQETAARMAQQLLASNQELTEFAHIVSHDLRAPLRHTRAYVELLTKSLREESDEQAELLLVIDQSATRMQEMVDDLLEFSQANSVPGLPALVQLERLIRSVFDEVVRGSKEAADTEIELELELNFALAGHKSSLRRLFQNLIQNAIRHGLTPGQPLVIRITGEKKGSLAELQVLDNGPGIPEKQQQRVFEMFTRLQKSRTGTGAGLAICRRLCELHEGTIQIKPSEFGANFALTLVDQSGPSPSQPVLALDPET